MKSRALNKNIITALFKSAFFFGMVFLPALVFAQQSPPHQPRGKVEVAKDPRVDSLIGNYLVGNKTAGKGAGPSSSYGFRVQIFSGSDRKEAYSVQAKFQDRHPETRTYLTYHEPNFKVHVGDFRSRIEAEKMVQNLTPAFTGLFIISEKINAPKLDTE